MAERSPFRRIDEQPEDKSERDDSDTNESATSRVKRWRTRSSEGYWARLLTESQAEKTKKSESAETDDSDEDDEDESSEASAENSKTKKKEKSSRPFIERFPRIKNLLSPKVMDVSRDNIAEPAKESTNANQMPTDYYESWSPSAVESIVGKLSEDPLVNGEEPPERQAEELPVLFAQRPSLETPTDTAQLETNTESTAEAVSEPIAEPESVEAILRRRQVEGNTSGAPEVVLATPVAHEQKTVHETNRSDRHVNNGLHLLNYGLAKRRDRINQQANKKQFKQVDQDIENLRRQADQDKKEMLKQQHLKRSAEINFNQPKTIEEIYNRDKQPKIVETTTPIYEKHPVLPNVIEQNKFIKPEKTPSLTGLTSPEAIKQQQEALLRQVAEATGDRLMSKTEMELDRRHEVMDTPRQAKTIGVVGVAAEDVGHQTGEQNLYTDSHNRQPTEVGGANSGKDKANETYRQVAISGAGGAIVGIIAFVIFYLLTR